MLSVRTKLIAALLFTGVASVALVGLAAHWRLAQKFSDEVLRHAFGEYRKDVAAYIKTYGTWERAEASESFTHFVVRRHRLLGKFRSQGMRWAPPEPTGNVAAEDSTPVPPLPPGEDRGQDVPPERLPPFRFLLLDPLGKVLRANGPYAKGTIAPQEVRATGFPIHVEGRQVAIAVPMGRPMLSPLDLGYLTAMREALVFGGAVAIGLAALLGIVLGNGLTRTLRQLILATRVMREGNLGQQVPVRSQDEVGALAAAFNHMSFDLAKSRDALQVQSDRAEQARAVAEQANAAKSSFLAAASHDLRQPLHALGLFAATLRRQRTGPDADEALAHLESSLAALRGLFEELLDVSRLDAGVVRPRVQTVRVQALFEAVLRDFAPLATGKGLRLKAVPTAASAESDPLLLERMVRNLVSNAIRYTRRGGVLLGCRRVGGRLRIDVADTGIGMAPDELERVFREFYQVARAGVERGEGWGLGLSIVDRLGRLLGHAVDVKSAPGRGTRFSITVLPAGDAAPTAQEEAPLPVAGKLEALVLVIDDEEAIRQGMEALLRTWGCTPLCARNGEEALAKLAAAGRAPDLIVTDYQLGGGATCLDAVAAVCTAWQRRIPAVVITGDTAASSLHAVEAGGHLVLHKPVMPAKLRSVLSRLLAAR